MALVDNDLVATSTLSIGTKRASSSRQLSGTLKAHATADTELPTLTVLVADGTTLRPFVATDLASTVRGFVWPNPVKQYVGGENIVGYMSEGRVNYLDIPEIAENPASAISVALIAVLKEVQMRELNIIITGGLDRE